MKYLLIEKGWRYQKYGYFNTFERAQKHFADVLPVWISEGRLIATGHLHYANRGKALTADCFEIIPLTS